MLTFKQLEAIYWVVQLGGFLPAAQKLNTTQSAVSKRIQELEALFHAPLLDRSQRSARLTSRGEELVAAAGRLLAEREALMQATEGRAPRPRRVRIGVTEVTAMTWLPLYVERLHAQHPEVSIAPEVESGAMLRDKLLASEIDLMIAADTFRDERFRASPVGSLKLQWMCKPGLVVHTKAPLKVQALQHHRILTQGPQSGTGILFQRWFESHNLKPGELVVSNSLIALIGLTLSGFGVSYLPPAAVQATVEQGLLEVLDVRPALPAARYAATIRREDRSTLMTSLVRLAQECCDFTRLYQTASGGPR
ncbi:LysR family transcriptional regulator [uncultured Hydrogenophaga sp.]|uniref:LysR family transcriptional regulator n=1 Tax=uncultured Hydrogenophaga sp. TaxID=199683 RepID=UPI00258D8B62|nr:LysR family transcriptional regulator [uncultured Hydrogenophaga sp.]